MLGPYAGRSSSSTAVTSVIWPSGSTISCAYSSAASASAEPSRGTSTCLSLVSVSPRISFLSPILREAPPPMVMGDAEQTSPPCPSPKRIVPLRKGAGCEALEHIPPCDFPAGDERKQYAAHEANSQRHRGSRHAVQGMLDRDHRLRPWIVRRKLPGIQQHKVDNRSHDTNRAGDREAAPSHTDPGMNGDDQPCCEKDAGDD